MLGKDLFRASILAAFLSAAIYGCADVPKDLNITQSIAENPVTVFGKVIDSQTRQGIGGATVYIKLNGSWKSTTTSSSTGVTGDTEGSGDSLAGDFKFTALPVNSVFPMIIKSPSTSSYLQVTTTVNTPDYSPNSNGVNSEITVDKGQFTMETGVTTTIYVADVNTSSYIRMSDDSALPIYWGLGGGAAGSVEDVMAAQDSTDLDKYTITIPQTGISIITVPAIDINADGIYDYRTNSVEINGVGAGSLTTTISLTPY